MLLWGQPPRLSRQGEARRIGVPSSLPEASSHLNAGPLHPEFLTPVWRAFRSRWDGWMTWSYWSDALVNISGFAPLGFVFTALFCFSRPVSQARMITVILGFTLSLTIESFQYFLPTRDSSMTDLLNNTLGTLIGVVLCRPALLRRISIDPAA